MTLGYPTHIRVFFIYLPINFALISIVLFIIMKYITSAKLKLEAIDKKNKDEEIESKKETTKICPYCISQIDIKASRCPHCTSVLEEKMNS